MLDQHFSKLTLAAGILYPRSIWTERYSVYSLKMVELYNLQTILYSTYVTSTHIIYLYCIAYKWILKGVFPYGPPYTRPVYLRRAYTDPAPINKEGEPANLYGISIYIQQLGYMKMKTKHNQHKFSLSIQKKKTT